MSEEADPSQLIIGCSCVALVWAVSRIYNLIEWISMKYSNHTDQIFIVLVYLIYSINSTSSQWYQFWIISQTKLLDPNSVLDEERRGLKTGSTSTRREIEVLNETYIAISQGADAFLRAEYTICTYFCAAFAVLIYVMIAWGQNSTYAFFTTVSFILGVVTSVASG